MPGSSEDLWGGDYGGTPLAHSGMRAATATPRRLILEAAMVVWWFMDLDVIFIMFEVFCIFDESFLIDLILLAKIK